MKRQKTSDMSCSAIETKPVDYDWGAHPVGDSDGEWEWWEAVECRKCGKYDTCCTGGGDTHDRNGTSKCTGTLNESDGPMMSYYYPLPKFPEDIHKACLAIRRLPLVIVRFDGDDDKAALALTGGGMNLSWEICEAFMRLGHLPPTHFELPAMCGRGTSAKDRWILRGYLKACRVQRAWLGRKAERAREAVASGVKHEAERTAEARAR
jgi:hypothetical protein